MAKENLSVREIEINDFESIADYFLMADNGFLRSMGVDASRLPQREEWLKLLRDDLRRTPEKKERFFIIWLLDGKPVGHSNINKIKFGEEAYMHLHLWNSEKRKKGIGTELLKLTIPCFFNTFKLKNLYCEPYALNPAPNKTLEKLGFDFIKRYTTIPGLFNFQQEVNRWHMSLGKYQSLY